MMSGKGKTVRIWAYFVLVGLGVCGLAFQPAQFQRSQQTPQSPTVPAVVPKKETVKPDTTAASKPAAPKTKAKAKSKGKAKAPEKKPEAKTGLAKKEEDSDSLKGKVIVIKVTTADVTDGARLRSLRTMLENASKDEASAVVLELNTRSGYSPDLAMLLMEELPAVTVPLYSFAKPSALGMGTLLALGSNAVYVSPAGIIGGAAPTFPEVKDGKGNTITKSNAQTVSVLKARVRSLAKVRGANPDVAAALIDPEFSLKLKIDGRNQTLSKEGEVLTLTAEEAVQVSEGKPLFAKGIIKSTDELIVKEGLTGTIVKTDPDTWGREAARKAIAVKPKAKGKSKGKDDSGKVAGGEGDSAEKKDDLKSLPPLLGRNEGESFDGKILVVKVGMQDLVSTARFKFMERILEKAKRQKPSALILDMDTPGGYAYQTMDAMLQTFQGLDCPTFTFVNPHAISAGSMLALATDHIYMYPTSSIGAALVITGGGADVEGDSSRKINSVLQADVEAVALAKGHDPKVARGFITKDQELVVDGVTLQRVGQVLTLNAQEAMMEHNGRPLLARGIVKSIEEIVEKEGLKGELFYVTQTPLESFAQWVQLISGMLIIVGIGAAYAEMNAPGFGLPGIISVVAFTTFFFGNYYAGNLAGYETAFFFIAGILLILIEVLFLGGGTVVVGALGALLVVGSLGFALVDRYDFEGWQIGGGAAPDFSAIFKMPVIIMAASLTGTMLLIMLLMRILPSLRPTRALILAAEVGGSKPEPKESALLGVSGVAASDLRPSGKGELGDEILDVTSESDFIEQGTAIKVIAVHGDRIVIARA